MEECIFHSNYRDSRKKFLERERILVLRKFIISLSLKREFSSSARMWDRINRHVMILPNAFYFPLEGCALRPKIYKRILGEKT